MGVATAVMDGVSSVRRVFPLANAMMTVGQDIRFAVRGLRMHPTFAIAAIATLALGIGANTAVFSVAHGVLAHPLPYPAPSQLVLLTATSQVSVPDGVDWRARSRAIAEVALFIPQWDFDLVGQGEPLRLRGSVAEPALFHLLGITPVLGRVLTSAEVAIVNEALAHQMWPTGPALGHRVQWVGAGDTAYWMTIVGVAGDVKSTTLTTGDAPAVYVPYVQRTESWQRFGTLVVRGSGDAGQLEHALRSAVHAVDPLVPVGRVAPMPTVRSRAIAQQRFDAIVLGVFSAAALILAVQGIYGTLAYVVEQQRREIGIRVAMGATPRVVRRVVVGRGMHLTAGGLVVGVAAAVAMGRVVRSLLYGVTASDPSTYLAVAAAIAAAAWLGALVPAIRASRADPLVALRGSR